MSQIVGYVHENRDRYMPVSVFEAWAAQSANSAGALREVAANIRGA